MQVLSSAKIIILYWSLNIAIVWDSFINANIGFLKETINFDLARQNSLNNESTSEKVESIQLRNLTKKFLRYLVGT